MKKDDISIFGSIVQKYVKIILVVKNLLMKFLNI